MRAIAACVVVAAAIAVGAVPAGASSARLAPGCRSFPRPGITSAGRLPLI